jgi:hypothetical protein
MSEALRMVEEIIAMCGGKPKAVVIVSLEQLHTLRAALAAREADGGKVLDEAAELLRRIDAQSPVAQAVAVPDDDGRCAICGGPHHSLEDIAALRAAKPAGGG